MVTEAQLQAELHSAMKARAMETVYVLRGLIAAIKNLKVDKQISEVPESDIAALVRKEIGQRSEALEFARKGNRPDLIAKNEAERALLEKYLPQQLDAGALEGIIKDIAAEIGSTQIGPVMAKLRERYAGQFDGKLASELIRKLAS